MSVKNTELMDVRVWVWVSRVKFVDQDHGKGDGSLRGPRWRGSERFRNAFIFLEE